MASCLPGRQYYKRAVSPLTAHRQRLLPYYSLTLTIISWILILQISVNRKLRSTIGSLNSEHLAQNYAPSLPSSVCCCNELTCLSAFVSLLLYSILGTIQWFLQPGLLQELCEGAMCIHWSYHFQRGSNCSIPSGTIWIPLILRLSAPFSLVLIEYLSQGWSAPLNLVHGIMEHTWFFKSTDYSPSVQKPTSCEIVHWWAVLNLSNQIQ